MPQKFISQRESSGSVIKTFADERLFASKLGILFFPSYRLGVAAKGNSIVLEKFPSSRRQNFTEVSYLGKNRSHLKIKFPQVNCQQVDFT